MNFKSLIPVRREPNDVRLFNPFLSLQREVEDVFQNFTRDWPTFRSAGLTTDLVPSTDVVENDKEIQITAELPGLVIDVVDHEQFPVSARQGSLRGGDQFRAFDQ